LVFVSREEHRLKVLENKALRRMARRKRDEVAGRGGNCRLRGSIT
jgi:hypothetical protein